MTEFKREVLSHYLDPELLVSRDRNPGLWTSGNGLLFTGTFYTLLSLRGEFDLEDYERMVRAVTPCWDDHNGKPVVGLLERNDTRPDKQAHDDYIGVCAAAFHTGAGFAREICDYGRREGWAFDNESPGRWSFDTWHSRFIGLIGFYNMCERTDPSWIQDTLFRMSLSRAPRGSRAHAGSKIMTWLKVTVAYRTHDSYKNVCHEFLASIKQDYGGLAGLFAEYFGDTHPFAKIKPCGDLIP